MRETNFILVGLGRLAQELLKRIPKDLSVTCVSNDDNAPAILKSLKREDVKHVRGDATSRIVLEDLDVNGADAIIISTTTERINIEIARVLAEHFEPMRIISVGITESGVRQLEEMGVEVENIFTASALGIRNKLEHKTKTPHAIGVGKGEILEVEVHPNSRLANKAVGLLKPLNWRLGIVYREGNIIVPRKETVLKPRDRVVILGDPAVLKNVSEVLTFNYQKFPLEYGSTMIAYFSGIEDDAYLRELKYIYSTLPLDRAELVLSERARKAGLDEKLKALELTRASTKITSLPPAGALEDALSEVGDTQGLVVVSGTFLNSMRSFYFDASKREFVRDLLFGARCPILVSRGTEPYESVLLPSVPGTEIEHVLETALQMTEDFRWEVSTAQVRPSHYISGEDEFDEFEERRKLMASIALMYKARVSAMILKGNPVAAILAEHGSFNLMMMSMDSREYGLLHSFLSPDVLWNIVLGSRTSTLILPYWAETL